MEGINLFPEQQQRVSFSNSVTINYSAARAILNSKGEITSCNDEFLQLTGRNSDQELQQTHISHFVKYQTPTESLEGFHNLDKLCSKRDFGMRWTAKVDTDKMPGILYGRYILNVEVEDSINESFYGVDGNTQIVVTVKPALSLDTRDSSHSRSNSFCSTISGESRAGSFCQPLTPGTVYNSPIYHGQSGLTTPSATTSRSPSITHHSLDYLRTRSRSLSIDDQIAGVLLVAHSKQASWLREIHPILVLNNLRWQIAVGEHEARSYFRTGQYALTLIAVEGSDDPLFNLAREFKRTSMHVQINNFLQPTAAITTAAAAKKSRIGALLLGQVHNSLFCELSNADFDGFIAAPIQEENFLELLNST